jgi:hypothetical protein
MTNRQEYLSTIEQNVCKGFWQSSQNSARSDKDVEVHHVNAMRKLHEYPGRTKPEWVKRMRALRRTTLVLCKRCHVAVEHGLPITWQLISLDEIKERRKKLNDAILQSRMH